MDLIVFPHSHTTTCTVIQPTAHATVKRQSHGGPTASASEPQGLGVPVTELAPGAESWNGRIAERLANTAALNASLPGTIATRRVRFAGLRCFFSHAHNDIEEPCRLIWLSGARFTLALERRDT